MPIEVRRSKLKFTPKANRVIARYFDPGDDERKKQRFGRFGVRY
jgi:hypothetical protein